MRFRVLGGMGGKRSLMKGSRDGRVRNWRCIMELGSFYIHIRIFAFLLACWKLI